MRRPRSGINFPQRHETGEQGKNQHLWGKGRLIKALTMGLPHGGADPLMIPDKMVSGSSRPGVKKMRIIFPDLITTACASSSVLPLTSGGLHFGKNLSMNFR
jgi:hypothetical protein